MQSRMFFYLWLIPFLAAPGSLRAGEVAINARGGPLPASGNCAATGDRDGRFDCVRLRADGSAVVFITQQEQHGNELKRLIRIAEFDARQRPLHSELIRQKKSHLYRGRQKKVRAEFLDVVNWPRGCPISRNIYHYEYDLKTQKPKKFSWSHYEQIEDSAWAEITQYIRLSFDENGRVLSRKTHQWETSKIVPADCQASLIRHIDTVALPFKA